MRTYTLKIVVEPYEGGFQASCGALRHLGAVTEAPTPVQALLSMSGVIETILQKLRADGKQIDDVWIDDSAVESCSAEITIVEQDDS